MTSPAHASPKRPLLRYNALLGTVVVTLAALSFLPLAAAQAGRIQCGKNSPKQHICDALVPPTSRRSMKIPLNSECVRDPAGGYFCGYAGASCTEDEQCDFGRCSSQEGEEGICLGGLGDSCEGTDGADDSLCAGNLGCSGHSDNGDSPVCGGFGAECLYTGSYIPGDIPNHKACVSGHCDSTSLICGRAPAIPPPRARVKLSPAAQKKDMLKQKKKKKAQQLQQQQKQQIANRQKQLLLEQQRLAAALNPPHAAEEDDEVTSERSEVDDEVVDVHHVQIGDEMTLSGMEDDAAASAPVQISVPAGSTCPRGFTICPVSRGLRSGRFDFGCFDTRTSVNMCGGCSGGPGLAWGGAKGEDCLAAPGVVSAACVDSKCRVFSCSSNFEFDRSTGTCRSQWSP